jgi:GTP:adenosylcobinamide-phosphate guanylyltransferase
MNLFIMAAGKSSRFGSPKILETFNYNKQIFEKYNITPIIVTTKEIFSQISFLDSHFFVSDIFGKGSGKDVYNLNKIFGPIIICWSDVFFNDDVLKDFLDNLKNNKNKNFMTLTYKKEPYVAFFTDDKKIKGYSKIEKNGYQDNSIFNIYKLDKYADDFLDLVYENEFYGFKTKNSILYFNTKEELEKIKGQL